MFPPKLIFIEGLPGAGKSTAAEILADRLTRHGVTCRWYHDFDARHPIQPPLGDPADLAVHMVRQWQDFVIEQQTLPGTTIVENRLWMRSAMHLFMQTDAADSLHSYQRAVADVLEPLEPMLIYLEQDNVALALGRLYGARGRDQLAAEIARAENQPWFRSRQLAGFEGWLYFFADWMALLQQLFADWPYAKHTVRNAHENWQQSYDEIMDFVTARRNGRDLLDKL